MNIGEFSIRRPVTTTLVMLAIVVFGLFVLRLLPVSDLPNVDFPTVVVGAALPGASPETMASAVATPLEKQFSTIAGIDSMSSRSSLGSTQVTLQFNLNRDIDAAAQDVQSAIAAIQRQLPAAMPSPPTYRKVNPADQPILFIALTSPTLPLSALDEYGETLIAQRMSMVSGVAEVVVYGAQKYATRIQLDPTALASRGIGINEVAEAISSANVNLPTGTLSGAQRAFFVRAAGQLTSAALYEPIVVAYHNGNPVRLRDVGRALDSVENNKTAAWYVNERSIVLAVQRQPGTNTVAVADEIKRLLPTFHAQLPASVSLHILYDRSDPIRASVHDVTFTLLLTLCLVVLVIFLFLRNVYATIVPSLALPMSIIGTFAVMYVLGYSVDNLSLMALTLCVGFVVDDAIVMLENIVRHIERGESVLDAAVVGSREITFTILSMTLSLVAVFIPLLFMGGILGRLFHEFAVTIGAAILISGFVSLTLTPMLSHRFLRPVGQEHHGRLFRVSERGFQAMLHLYDVTLRAALRFRRVTLFVAVLTIVFTGYLFYVVPKGFLPSEDHGQIIATTEAAEGISYSALVEHQQAVAAVAGQDDNVDSFMSSTGGRAGVGVGNTGSLLLRLKPRAERQLSADQLIQVLRRKLSGIPGIRVSLQNPPPISVGGRTGQGQYQYTLQTGDTAQLYTFGPLLEQKVRALPGFQDVTSDLRMKNPEVDVGIDRDKASVLGVTAEQIEDALYTAYGTRQVSTIYAPNNTYQVIMELLPQYQLTPESLSLLYLHSASGKLVPLSAVTRITQGLGPLTVNHTGQLPSVTISFNLNPGVALGDAVTAVEKAARETLPAGIATRFQGTAQAFQSSLTDTGVLLVMALLVIYLVLGILYESFIHPITVLSGLPSAGVGALLTLMIFHVDLNLYAFVGIIMLVGIVKKNGIMMIDFALDAQRTEGKRPEEAIYQACLIRFRPIMMTTMSALMASLPIAIGFGAGAESRRPLGLSVVGGLMLSQLLTLYITPVIYVYMAGLEKRLSRAHREQPAPATLPQPAGDARAPAGRRRSPTR